MPSASPRPASPLSAFTYRHFGDSGGTAATTAIDHPLLRSDRRQRAPRGADFYIYVGDSFEEVVADQVEFLTRHLSKA